MHIYKKVQTFSYKSVFHIVRSREQANAIFKYNSDDDYNAFPFYTYICMKFH